jgi:hypothetical protein
MPRRLSDEEVKRRLAAKGFPRPLSKYKGKNKPIKVRCPLCGKPFRPVANSIFSGHTKSCGCARQRAAAERRLSEAEAFRRFAELGFERLGKYVDTKTLVKLRCPYCGKPFDVIPASVFSRQTKSCGCHQRRRASECRKLPDDEVDRRLAAKGFTRLTEYKGCDKPIRVACPDCGEGFSTTLSLIRDDKVKRCKSCTRTMTGERLRKDIAGERHGLLVALYPIKKKGKGPVVWVVKCDCGKERHLTVNKFRQYQSCGCRMNRTGKDNPC